MDQQKSEILQELKEKRAQRAEANKKKRRLQRIIGCCVAAALLIAVLLAILLRPTPPTPAPPVTDFAEGSYFAFGTIDHIKELLLAAESSEDIFRLQLEMISEYPEGSTDEILEDLEALQLALQRPIPFSSGGFDILKFDPDTNRFDMLMKINGLTYRFVSNTDGTIPTGRPIADDFQIFGEAINLYRIDGHLWGYFQKDDRNFIIEIFTDDPSIINLSQFQFGLLMEDM